MRELDAAIEAAWLGGQVLIENQADAGELSRKIGTDIVTATDIRSEAVILSSLRGAFPLDAIHAEESGRDGVASERLWSVDPLDGTVNFANGIPYFAVSIGLEDAAGARLGVVLDPVRGDCFAAERGSASVLNGVSLPHRTARSVRDSVVAVQLPEPGWRERPSLVDTVLGSRGHRVSGSVALDLAWTAAGRYDVCLYRRTPQRWDWVAGEFLVASSPGCAVISLGSLGGLELMAAGEQTLVTELAALTGES